MSETLSEIMSALGDLIDEIKDWELEHDDYFYPDSDEKLVARREDLRERLVACGDAAIEPLEEYLYNTETHAHIIAVDVLGEIGSPAAIQRLVDAVELGHNRLPLYAARTLAEIGAGSVQPLIERITDQLDNPVLDEEGGEADITNMVDALSRIVDPRSFDFMVKLLDRFENAGRFEDLAHLCSRFHDQHNPEIIPRLRALVDEYDDCDGSSNQVAVDARDTIRCLEVDQAIASDDWIIYGCCNICRDYDHAKGWCQAFEEYTPFDHFCPECEPIEEFCCDVCHLKRVLSAPGGGDSGDITMNGCNIDSMPPVYANLKCHLAQEEFSDRFKITANYDHVGGLIVITNDHGIEFCFWYDTLDDLDMLRDFFRGKRSHFPGEMRFFINCGKLFGKPDLDIDGKSGKAVRNDRGVVTAVCECDQFGVELAFDQEAIDVLVAIIDTQRFLLLCDSYTRMDEFYEDKDNIISAIRSLKESGELGEPGGSAEKSEIEESQPCDHEFKLLKTHKKYTVYRCTICGETKKEFN